MDKWDLKPEKRVRVFGHGGFGPGVKGAAGKYVYDEKAEKMVKVDRHFVHSPLVKCDRGLHFDRGLRGYVKNESHRQEILKARGLVEVGNL